MQGRGNRAPCRCKEPVCGRLALSMSLRGAQRGSNLLVLVDANRDSEIAAASFGWPRNDIERRNARLRLDGRSGRKG